VLKLSNRFFGAAVVGGRFFFGFRRRLLGMGKQWVGALRFFLLRRKRSLVSLTPAEAAKMSNAERVALEKATASEARVI
jgi:hypothetical protein